ncbi:hypothetical protein [Pseudoneobacillus sp. C159]
MNRVGRYAQNESIDEILLMRMVFELSEKDRMLMWQQGYIDLVIEKMPGFAKNILEDRLAIWEDNKEYAYEQLKAVVQQKAFIEATKKLRKEFAIFVMNNYPDLQSLLFKYYDRKLTDEDLRKFVYQRRFGTKKYLH